MQANQVLTVALTILILFVGLGIVIWPYFRGVGIPSLVFWWIWLGFWVALFECELFGNRELLSQLDQPAGTWVELWREYSIHADRRYVSSPQNRVHLIEINNAYVSFALFALLLLLVTNSRTLSATSRYNILGLIVILLIFQAVNTVAYFATWQSPANQGLPMTPKAMFYLFLSALWVIVPLVAVAYLIR